MLQISTDDENVALEHFQQYSLSLSLSVYLPTHLSIYLSVCLSVCLSIYGSTALYWALAAFQFLDIFTQSVGLLWRGISSSQARYLHTGQHTNTEWTHTDIHVLSGIRTHDLSVRASEGSSCLRPHGHRDRPSGVLQFTNSKRCRANGMNISYRPSIQYSALSGMFLCFI
jgi:hypothetical protein